MGGARGDLAEAKLEAKLLAAAASEAADAREDSVGTVPAGETGSFDVEVLGDGREDGERRDVAVADTEATTASSSLKLRLSLTRSDKLLTEKGNEHGILKQKSIKFCRKELAHNFSTLPCTKAASSTSLASRSFECEATSPTLSTSSNGIW